MTDFTIHYPVSGATVLLSGEYQGVQPGEPLGAPGDVPVILLTDGAQIGPHLIEPGTRAWLDPRCLVMSGAETVYHPRYNLGMAAPLAAWMRAHPHWPGDWTIVTDPPTETRHR